MPPDQNATNELIQLYQQVAAVHGFTGLVGKIALASVLGAVAGGNKKPGEQLLAAVIAIQMVMAGYIMWSTASTFRLGGWTASAAVIVSVVVGLAVFISLFNQEGEWTIRKAVSWRKWVGGALIFWAFWFPVFNSNWLSAIFFSPVSVLPHSTLIAAGAAAWLSLPNCNRLVAYSLAFGLIMLGLIDFAAGTVASAAVPLLLGLALSGELLYGTIKSGGIIEDDTPPVDKERKERQKKEIKEKTAPQKQWKLK